MSAETEPLKQRVPWGVVDWLVAAGVAVPVAWRLGLPGLLAAPLVLGAIPLARARFGALVAWLASVGVVIFAFHSLHAIRLIYHDLGLHYWPTQLLLETAAFLPSSAGILLASTLILASSWLVHPARSSGVRLRARTLLALSIAFLFIAFGVYFYPMVVLVEKLG